MSALIWPVANYSLSSPYGPRDGGYHYGDDLAAPNGTPIVASGDGTVAAAGAASGFGQWVIIDHIINGSKYSTVYGHMYPSGVHVHAGQIVRQGDHIADVGANGEATGPHCHFEVWQGGRLTGGHAVDPASVVDGSASLNVQTVGNSTGGGGLVDNVKNTWSFIQFVTDPNNWRRMFLFIAGAAVIIYVLWSTMNGAK